MNQNDLKGLTLGEVIRRAIEARVAELRVALPGEIVSFDPKTQTAEVRPALGDVVEVEDGSTEVCPLEVLPHVPVQFPGAGGFSLTFPVRRGDPCLLVFTDRALDAWWANGGQVPTTDARAHHLSDAVAILGVRPRPAALPAVDGAAVSLGQDGAPADFAALASKVDAALEAIRTAFNSHIHTGGSGPTGTPQDALQAPKLIAAPESVASGSVKIRG